MCPAKRGLFLALLTLMMTEVSVAQNNKGIQRTMTPVLSGGAESVLDQMHMQKGVQALNIPLSITTGSGYSSQQLTTTFEGVTYDDNMT
jgi:hypothetical protein